MKNQKPMHTPGPWVVDSKYKLTVRPTLPSTDPRYPGPAVVANQAITELHREYGEFGNGNIAHMESQFHAPHAFITWEQAIANARLIAAAPELLEACKKALTCASLNSDVRQLIESAIAKATNPQAEGEEVKGR